MGHQSPRSGLKGKFCPPEKLKQAHLVKLAPQFSSLAVIWCVIAFQLLLGNLLGALFWASSRYSSKTGRLIQ